MNSPEIFAFSLGSSINGVMGSSQDGLEYTKSFQFAQLENMDHTSRTFSDMVTAASSNVAELGPAQNTAIAQAATPVAPHEALSPQEVAQTNAVPPPANVDSLDPQEKARRALSLPAAATKAADTGGDTILNGLQKLRNVFDNQIHRINQATNGPLDNTERLLRVQTEVLQFTMLVEISGKLVGKSTQAFETLLKGQ